MRDSWYSDKKDLVKWGVLFRLAKLFDAPRILQVAYYRPSEWEDIVIDGQQDNIPQEVIAHFRDMRNVASINSNIRVTVYDPLFQNRDTYLQGVLAFISVYQEERCVVFLDPDTGLEPQNPSLDHILESEVRAIWEGMKSTDLLVVYQHRTNRKGQSWIEPKREQLEGTIGRSVKTAKNSSTNPEAVLFYVQRP